MDPLRHISDATISAFHVNEKGQLCIPNHDYPSMYAIFNKIMEYNGNVFFGFSSEYISEKKGW